MLDKGGAQGSMLTRDLVGLTLSVHVPLQRGDHGAPALQKFIKEIDAMTMLELRLRALFRLITAYNPQQ